MSRLVDRGAIFAGWVGVGAAVVVVVAFALILPLQAVVYLLALPTGVLIGWYANTRAARYRPRARVMLNAAWAGLLSGLAMAVFYVGIRLVFVYGDSGYPDFNRVDPATRQPIPPYCATGPDCTYQRYLAVGREPELRAVGVTDAASFERYIVGEYLTFGGLMIVLSGGGAALAATWRAVSRPPASELAGVPLDGAVEAAD